MTIQIFDDEPQPVLPVRPSSPPPPRRGRSRRGLLLGSLGLAVLAGSALGGWWWLGRDWSPSDESTASASFLVPASPTRPKGGCFDASRSSGDHGATAAQALRTTRAVVSTWTTGTAVPENRRVPARLGLDLVLRVVQADSYTTAAASRYTVNVSIPPVAGLDAPAPVGAEDDYLERSTRYEREHRRVVSQLRRARTAVQRGGDEVGRLVGQGSSGSDVTGCVLALAAILGPRADILVVSDLKDTRFTAPDGADLSGRLQGVRVWIAQACPSGIPATCEAQRATFVRHLRPLGLDPGSVTSVRPELAASAVHTWLGR